MKFTLGCELTYVVGAATTVLLNVEPAATACQTVLNEGLTVPEASKPSRFVSEVGNRFVRFELPIGHSVVTYQAEVDLVSREVSAQGVGETPISQVPFEVIPYLLPSRYCQSDRLARFAMRQFNGLPPGHSRVAAICAWIHENVDYLHGTSTDQTSAYDTFALRAGVCRDFAHLGITFCRALGIPARIVSCYAWRLQPPDFHSVFEAYLEDNWYLFDPTCLASLAALVRISVGRDAADVAFASIYGTAQTAPPRVWIDTTANPAPRNNDAAVSIC